MCWECGRSHRDITCIFFGLIESFLLGKTDIKTYVPCPVAPHRVVSLSLPLIASAQKPPHTLLDIVTTMFSLKAILFAATAAFAGVVSAAPLLGALAGANVLDSDAEVHARFLGPLFDFDAVVDLWPPRRFMSAPLCLCWSRRGCSQRQCHR